MKKWNKTIAKVLVAAMMLGCFAHTPYVYAEGGSDIGQPTSEEPSSEEPKSEEPTSEEPKSEEPTSEEPKSEEPTSEEKKTEEPKKEEETKPVRDANLVDTNLSPADAKVVVIDPGHCKKHPGAYGNGLREEVVTMDIARACEDVLKQYGDITVYMTREDGGCCTHLNLGDCLSSRNNYAKFLDANFLVSMHINAGYSNGANLLVAYKSGYHDNIRVETQAFGRIALAKLKGLGIANRGFLLRKSESGNRYVNGKLADYYSIVRKGVVQQVPSVIIEHGYITSASDCSKYFKTAAKRKKVGEADAAAIIEYYGLNKQVVEGNFVTEGVNTYFVTADNKKAAGWVKKDGKWYYCDEMTGILQKGFITVKDVDYFTNPATGEMAVGWFTYGTDKFLARGNGSIVKNVAYSDGIYSYLFDVNGKVATKGFHTMEDGTYYVDKKNHLLKGVTKIGTKYYVLDSETGKVVYGYQKMGSSYYYTDPDTGVMARKKIVEIEDDRYYFGANGKRQAGFVTIGKSRYYFNAKSGKMVTGWKKISGRYYYFDEETGKMQRSKWIGKYYVNASGIRTKKK